MIKQDYILKIIDQLAKILKIIIDSKAKNKPIELYLQRVYDDIIKLDREKVIALSGEEVIQYLKKTNTNIIFWDFLVDLILIEADTFEQEKYVLQIEKSIYMLRYLEQISNKVSLTRKAKIEYLEKKLK